MPTTIDALELKVTSDSSSAASGINALTASLTKLKTAVSGGVSGLNTTANQITKLNNALVSVNGASAQKITTLAKALGTLSSVSNVKISASIGNQIRNISDSLKTLNGNDYNGIKKMVEGLAPLSEMGKATNFTSTVNSLSKIPKVAKELNAVDWNSFNEGIEKSVSALSKLQTKASSTPGRLKNVSSSMRSVGNAAKESSGKISLFSSKLGTLLAGAVSYRMLAKGIATAVNVTNEYIEDMNLFTVSMGEYAEEASKYAEKVGEALGIDPPEWMRQQGIFNNIITGFGVASDKAYLMSKNLTQLGYDMSSFYNVNVEEAMTKLTSGISGELEPLRRWGYDLSVARLQQEALNLGITKSVNAMTQAEKSQLRYYAIMTQVTTAQGDMARTINAPANQLRVLKAQLIQCARAIGTIFIPALNAILPYAIAVVKAITYVINAIRALLGLPELSVDFGSGASTAAAAVSDMADDSGTTAGNLGKAASNAKKMKDYLLGIDELNVLSQDDPTSSGSGGSGGSGGAGVGGGDLGFDLPEYDFLSGLTENRVTEIFEDIKRHLADLEAVASVAMIALGLILIFTGNIPLGIAALALGVAGYVAAKTVLWDKLSKPIKQMLSAIEIAAGTAMLALGLMLIFAGQIPLGVALVVVGAAMLVSALVMQWKLMENKVKMLLSTITAIAGGFALAVGLFLIVTGTNIPLGIALVVVGAAAIASAVAISWTEMESKVTSVLSSITSIIGGFLLAIGVMLVISANFPLGIPLIVAGAATLVTSAVLNWKSAENKVDSVLSNIMAIIGGALLAIGVMLTISGNFALGIPLIIAGVTTLVSAMQMKFNFMSEKVKTMLTKIGLIISGFLLVIGVILLLIPGVGTSLGIGLIIAGVASLVAGVAINWNSIKQKVQTMLRTIKEIVVKTFMLALGVILLLVPGGQLLGIAIIKEAVSSMESGESFSFSNVVSDVETMLGDIEQKFEDFKKKAKEKLQSVKDKFSELGDKVVEFEAEVKNTASEWWSNVKGWWSEKVGKVEEFTTGVKNNAKTWWSNTKQWWSEKVGEVKKFTTGVKNQSSTWWKNTKTWWNDKVGAVSNFITNVKDQSSTWWSNTKQWWNNKVGAVSSFTTNLKNTAKTWWSNAKQWWNENKGTLSVTSLIALARNGWTSVAKWIYDNFLGGAVDITINLVQGWAGSLKSWLGLSNGGYMTDTNGNRIASFAKNGAYFNGSGMHSWGNIPMYANGTANAGLHGSMFIAGEHGAEMVGHLNGQTEVLNKSQITIAMRNAVIAGMSQFVGYFRMLNSTIAASANAVSTSNIVASNAMQLAYAEGVQESYANSVAMAQSMYAQSREAYESVSDNQSNYDQMRVFYTEYVAPTLNEIRDDTKRQADKEEQTVVNIGARSVNNAIKEQKAADGYSFTK